MKAHAVQRSAEEIEFLETDQEELKENLKHATKACIFALHGLFNFVSLPSLSRHPEEGSSA